MHPIIQEKLPDLRELCVQHRVERLDLFGSAARDDFAPETSDLDFLVKFEPMSPVEHADSFFGLLADLKRLFGRPVDLLEAEPIENPYLWSSIVRSRKALYEAASPHLVARSGRVESGAAPRFRSRAARGSREDGLRLLDLLDQNS